MLRDLEGHHVGFPGPDQLLSSAAVDHTVGHWNGVVPVMHWDQHRSFTGTVQAGCPDHCRNGINQQEDLHQKSNINGMAERCPLVLAPIHVTHYSRQGAQSTLHVRNSLANEV